jgi:hypothetical protein
MCCYGPATYCSMWAATLLCGEPTTSSCSRSRGRAGQGPCTARLLQVIPEAQGLQPHSAPSCTEAATQLHHSAPQLFMACCQGCHLLLQVQGLLLKPRSVGCEGCLGCG